MYFWLVCWSVAYPSQYCDLRLAEMLALYNFLWSLLLMIVPLGMCSTPHQSSPPAAEPPVFTACPALVDPTLLMELGWGVEHTRLKCHRYTAGMQSSVVILEWILLNLLYAFSWFPFLKWLLLTNLSSFSLLLEKFCQASYLLFQNFSPFPPTCLFISFFPQLPRWYKFVIKTQQYEMYKVEMKSIHCSHP